MRRFPAFMLCMVCALPVSASDDDKRVHIVKVEAGPSLDDYASGTGPGAQVEGFVQREPGDLVPVSEPTRAFLSYDNNNGILPNESLVALERRKHLTADVLMTYLVHPGTALYVGYTDGYDNLQRDPLNDGYRPGGSPTVSTGRQVFVKTSYLFRF